MELALVVDQPYHGNLTDRPPNLFPAAAIGIIAAFIGLILHGSIAPYLGVLKLIGLMTTMVVLGITLTPYLILRRGSILDYIKTMASVPPLMIYLAFANGAKILQTLQGRKSSFKRTLS